MGKIRKSSSNDNGLVDLKDNNTLTHTAQDRRKSKSRDESFIDKNKEKEVDDLPYKGQTNFNSNNNASSNNDSSNIDPKPTLSYLKKKKRRNKPKTKTQVTQTASISENSERFAGEINPTEKVTKESIKSETFTIDEISARDNEANNGSATASSVTDSQKSKLNMDLLKVTQLSTPLSPRKQAIMRYKNSDDEINKGSFINEIKVNLKNKDRNSSQETDRSDGNKYSLQNNLDMDEKVTLFKYKSSKILVFDEQLHESYSNSSGRLLGHGEFEIFQLHNGDVTYLSCGPSFIYPLLPKLKILRINFNQFILPIVNPERYWKIFINSDESNVIEVLESTFERVVKYRNLFFENNNRIEEKETNDIKNIDKQPRELKTSSVKDEIESNNNDDIIDANIANFPALSNEIKVPESPPSAPTSPRGLDNNDYLDLLTPTKNPELGPGWSLNRKRSDQSITSAMASLDIRNTITNNFYPSTRRNEVIKDANKLFQPRPQRFNQSNPYQEHQQSKETDQKSDSSMDSLLDEYEENISITKPRAFPESKVPPRKMSIASSSFINPPNYSSQSFQVPVAKMDNLSNDVEDFPTTSLSEYNRIHNGGLSKSRRSSRSEMYSSANNRMESNRFPKSRSTFSVSSNTHQNTELNNTYKKIYKSITQRNLAHFLDDESSLVKSHRQQYIQPSSRSSIVPNTSSQYLNHKGSYASSVISERIGSSTRYNDPRRKNLDALNNKNIKLDSSEIYKIINSSRSKHSGHYPVQNNISNNSGRSLASRLFGW